MSKNKLTNNEEDFSNQFVKELMKDDAENDIEVPNIDLSNIDIDKELEEGSDIDIIYPIDMDGENIEDDIYVKVEEEESDILKIDNEQNNVNLNEDFEENEPIRDENIFNNDFDIHTNNEELDNNDLFNLNINEDEDVNKNNVQESLDLNTEGDSEINNNKNENSILSKIPKIQELKEKKDQLEEKVHGKKNLKILVAMTGIFVVISGFVLRDITKTFLIQDTPLTEVTQNASSTDDNKFSSKDNSSLGSLLSSQSSDIETNSSKKTQISKNEKKQSDLDLLVQVDTTISDNFINMQSDIKKYNQKLLIYNTFKSAIDKKVTKIDELKKILISDAVLKDSDNSEMISILNQRINNQEEMFKLIDEYLDTDKGISVISNTVNQYIETDKTLKLSQNEVFLRLLDTKRIEYIKDSNENIIIK